MIKQSYVNFMNILCVCLASNYGTVHNATYPSFNVLTNSFLCIFKVYANVLYNYQTEFP